MNNNVLAFLVFVLGYQIELMGLYLSTQYDLTAIWITGIGFALTLIGMSSFNDDYISVKLKVMGKEII